MSFTTTRSSLGQRSPTFIAASAAATAATSIVDAFKLRRIWASVRDWVRKHSSTLAWLLVLILLLFVAYCLVSYFWRRRSISPTKRVDLKHLQGTLSCGLDATSLAIALEGTWFEHYRLINPRHPNNWFAFDLEHVTVQFRQVHHGPNSGFLQVLNTGLDARGVLFVQQGDARLVHNQDGILLVSYLPLVEHAVAVLDIVTKDDDMGAMLVLGDPDHGSLRLLTKTHTYPTNNQLLRFHATAERYGYARTHDLNQCMKRVLQD